MTEAGKGESKKSKKSKKSKQRRRTVRIGGTSQGSFAGVAMNRANEDKNKRAERAKPAERDEPRDE